MEQRIEVSGWPEGLRCFDWYLIQVPGDGSCLIHSILRAYFMQYIANDNIGRTEMVKKIRGTLSRRLAEVPEGSEKNIYQMLMRGNLEEFSQQDPQYSLKNMQATLGSSSYLGEEYIEYLSHAFDLDIYIININKNDIYLNFFNGSEDLFLKGRNSIVLIYDHQGKHFMCGAIKHKGQFQTVFSPQHKLIRALNQRRKDLTDKK